MTANKKTYSNRKEDLRSLDELSEDAKELRGAILDVVVECIQDSRKIEMDKHDELTEHGRGQRDMALIMLAEMKTMIARIIERKNNAKN